MSKSAPKIRIQLDLRQKEVRALDDLRELCAGRSRADAVRTALAIMEWVREETSRGRRILAVGSDDVSALVVPGFTTRVATSGIEK